VIDLGTRPAIPPIPGLAEARPLTSETLLALERIPERLVVLGGSYVGVELAQAMRRFGSRVTIVERGPHLLAREDEDVAAAVAKIFREDGIEVLLECEVQGVERLAGGGVRVEVEGASGTREVLADDVLAALGRRPETEGIDIDAAGVELDERGFVRVDERLRTSEPAPSPSAT
jgi:pyruvate/2-oxoglutarate dehydrogenase complex dihydrolipoamide dehydrogenase (E3) component